MFRAFLLAALFFCPFVPSRPASAQDPNDPAVLWSQATLYRDEWGVPHIFADNLRAMAFAFGYAQADDHLDTMLLAYRAANGRMAEVYGEAYAGADEFALMMGHGDLARQAYASADFATRDLCEGFALGVNHWLVLNAADAPEWAEGVQPTDVLAFMHYYLMSQAPFDYDKMARRPMGTASGNAWAVSPSHSTTDEAMLVINPHTAYNDVFQWYEAHLIVAGVNMTGATLFGLPVLLVGHNRHLGWALTPNQADFADVFVESKPTMRREPNSVMDLRQASETLYTMKTIAESRPYYVRTAAGFEERRVLRQLSAYGPVVAHWSGRPLAYRVGGYGEFGAIRQLLAMAESESLEAFQAALTMHQLPCFHVVYADKEGNLFYLYNAKVGQKQSFPRAQPQNPLANSEVSPWDAPVSAVDSSFQWGEIIPPAYLPFQANPVSGFIQACGSPPWRASGDTPDWNVEGLQWLARDEDSYRARRVRQLLGQGPRSFEDMQAMIFDPLAPFAVDVVPYLLKLAEEMPELIDSGHPDMPAALDALRDWNHVADESSIAMTIFNAWWLTFKEQCPVPLRSDADAYRVLQEDHPALKEFALRALSEAVTRVRNSFQTINVPWGEVHSVSRGQSSVPMSGGAAGEPILVTGQAAFEGDRWPVNYGYGFAMAVKFSTTPESMSIVPFGTSERADSRHFRDQLELFADRRMKPVHFSEESVERAATKAWGSRIVFRPADGAAAVRIRAQQPVHARVESADEHDGAIPPAFAAFTRLIAPVVEPNNAAAEVIVEFTIAESLCAQGNLGELAIYSYHESAGWMPLGEQRLDLATRTFTGRLDGTSHTAVLGPARLRRSPVMLAAETSAPPIAPRPIVPLPRGYTPLHDRPQEPSGEIEVSSAPMETSAPVDAIATPQPTPAPAALAPVQEAPSTAPTWVASNPLPQSDVPTTAESAVAPSPTATEERTEVASAAPEPEKKARVRWSSAPLSELVDKRYKPRHTLFLVPDNALASPMQIGTNFALRPPVPGALFHVKTEKTIRAQVQVLSDPPAPLPGGLAAFTRIFSIEYESMLVPGRVAVSMQVQAGVCASENIQKLQLYTYDLDHGWQPVTNADIDPAARSFSALDFAIRAYAVLGPAELLVRSPSG